MFNNTNLFYFASIRKTCAAVGTLFSNIQIQRFPTPGGVGTPTKTIQIPFSFAPSMKWLDQREELVQPAPAIIETQNKKIQVRKTLPRMSLELMDLQYDAGRKLQTMNYVSRTNSNVSQVFRQLVPVPFDYMFDLNIRTKEMDDSFQILEQILPNFTPDFNLTIMDIPELNIKRDVQLIFSGMEKEDNYESALDTDRQITWTLHFVAKGHLYPAINNSGIIKTVIEKIYTDASMSAATEAAQIVTKVEPQSAGINDSWTPETFVYERDSGDPQELDSNGDPISDSNG